MEGPAIPPENDSGQGIPESTGLNKRRSFDETTATAYEKDLHHANNLILAYLKETVPGFRKLKELREKRNNADFSDENMEKIFYDMMKAIGHQLQHATGVFSIPKRSSPDRILDCCMAPGGLLGIALECSPGSHALGFSLPVVSGGHKIRLPYRLHVKVRTLNITMLAADMGVTSVAAELRTQPELANEPPFDLVICDGVLLRTQARASYRDNSEARRLMTTQLALGLQHLLPGGSMLVLLHKPEAYHTMALLATFSKFATVRLFKPAPQHAKRSSFYMIATNVQAQDPAALAAVEMLKEVWRVLTFGTEEEPSKRALHSVGGPPTRP